MVQDNVRIRPAGQDDLDALYAISLATGDAGGSAAHLYDDPCLIGHIYMAPYVVLTPEWCLIAEDDDSVAGYVAGTPDTIEFAARLEADWWPELRRHHPDPGPPPHKSADQARHYQIHHPDLPPGRVMAHYPAHMHMNLLPRLRGRGVGRRLFEAWCELAKAEGVSGVHVGVSPRNAGGAAFWQACGMAPLANADKTKHPALWLGTRLDGREN